MNRDSNDTSERSWVRRIIRFLTFVDQPIKRRFSLFFVGVLWWFVVMTALSIGTMIEVREKVSVDNSQVMPMRAALHDVGRDLEKLQSVLSSYVDKQETAPRSSLVMQVMPLVDAMGAHVSDVDRLKLQGYHAEALKQLVSETKQNMTRMISSLESDHPVSSFSHIHRELLEGVNTSLSSVQKWTREIERSDDRRNTGIQRVVTFAAAGSFSVLLLATALLALFTYYIRKAIGTPINLLIRQMDALVEGNSDLSARMEVHSEDEIGILTQKLNMLTDKLHSLTIFKRVIEEDPHVDDVYSRLEEIFKKFDLGNFRLYDVQDDSCPVLIYPKGADDWHVEHDLRGKIEGEQCRAIKANKMITSMDFPGICDKICKAIDQEHACIPVMFSSGSFVIAQFLFDKMKSEDERAQMFRKLRRVSEFLDTSRNVIETKRLLGELRESAIRDSLTGLYNRRFLSEIIESIVPGVMRRGEKLGVVMCDIDHFKQINDQYGHDAGDAVLKTIAGILNSHRRAADMVVRYGGEEFLLVFRDMEHYDPMEMTERLRERCAQAHVHYKGAKLTRTVSFGVSLFPDDGEDFWEVVRYADDALFKAKSEGRNMAVRHETLPQKSES